MSTREVLAALQRGVHQRFGLVFSGARTEAFARGVARVADTLTGGSTPMLLAKLQQEDDETLAALAEELTIPETYFFRDAQSFPVIDDAVQRALQAGRALRIWSAGCSTGEEPYSLAIRALEAAAGAPLRVEVEGTDLSRRALDHAGKGVYRPRSFRGVSQETRARWFEPLEGSELRRPIEGVRRLTHFRRANLLESKSAPLNVDVVFCRNVFIYFDARSIDAALESLILSLAPDGVMVLGPSDPLVHDPRLRIEQAGGFLAYRRVSPSSVVPAPPPEGPAFSVPRALPELRSRAGGAPRSVRGEDAVASAQRMADRGELSSARALLAESGEGDAAKLLSAFVAFGLGDSEGALRDVRALTVNEAAPALAHVLDAMVSARVGDVKGARDAIVSARAKLGTMQPGTALGNGAVASDASAALSAIERQLRARGRRRKR